MASITLLDVENDLAESLAQVLRHEQHDVFVTNSMESALVRPGSAVLFAGGDTPDYGERIRQIKDRRPDLPLILVNRHPENARWLDALELGATDYCGAPFESIQVKWLLDSVKRA